MWKHYVFLFAVIFCTWDCAYCYPDNKTDDNVSNQLSVYDIKVDICYWVTTGSWPHWIGHAQIKFRRSLMPKLFRGKSNDSLIEACSKYEAVVLNPDNNPMEYDLCWYAKYGIWKKCAMTRAEESARRHMIEEYLYDNDERISGWKIFRLCPNLYRMECKDCALALERNCHYARYGRWKSKAPTLAQQRKFFYTGAKRVGVKELIKKCPGYFDKFCKVIHYPDCRSKSSSKKY